MRSARRILSFAALIVLGALALGASTIPLPYYSIGPGPAREVAPLIRVGGRPVYASAGRFVMTSVHIDQVTALGALFAWLDPHTAIVQPDELFAPGEGSQEERQRAISQMDQSKLDAAYVVLHELEGYPKDHGRGVLVESVVDGCAADGELFPGDLITAIDDVPIPGLRAASRAIESAPSGSTLRFDVMVDGQPEHVDLARRPCGGERKPLVGLRMIPRFPFSIRISSGDVGGPSAGLMWAVALYDLLTPGDLTGGRTIAGTGAIGIDGTVYPIGGIEEKIVAAKDAGADVLLVPKDNVREARAAGIRGILLVPVGTFDEAVAWLREHA